MATISFTTKFNLTTSPKKFVFIDTSDWAGQGIATADVNGSFHITSPSGVVIYNNTTYTDLGCDIDISSSTTNQTTISLPLAANGLPELGVYTIVYTVFNSALSEYYTLTSTYTNSYVRPEVAISQTVDCISPLFTSTDITNYTVNSVDPVITEVHTIYYPNGSAGQGSPVIGSTLIVSTGTFYNGTQTTTIESDLTYTFSDGLIVIDFIEGSQEIVVDCTDTCAIYCCVRSIEQQMMQAATSNQTAYATLKSLFSQIMGLVGMVSLARICNKGSDISGYLTAIKDLAHCTDDCDCSGDEPTQVMGLGGLVNQVIVDSAGSPLAVTPVTVGNTTTYTISFDSTLLSKLNSLYSTEVSAGNNITVSSVGPVADVKTFTVNGLKTTTSEGYGIDITATGPTLGVTDYAIATSLVASQTSESTNFTLVASPGSLDTFTVAAPTTGTYLVIFESMVLNTDDAANEISISYGLSINGAPPGLSDRREFNLPVASGFSGQVSIYLNSIVNLTAAQTVGFWGFRNDAVTELEKRSITLIRLA